MLFGVRLRREREVSERVEVSTGSDLCSPEQLWNVELQLRPDNSFPMG